MNNSHSCNNGKYLNKPETTMIERIDDNKNIIKNIDSIKIIIIIKIIVIIYIITFIVYFFA